MARLPEGRLCHLSAGRLRVRIPERRRDVAYFRRIEEVLAGWASVERVTANPATASVLIEFRDASALLRDNAQHNDLFTVAIAAEPDADSVAEFPLLHARERLRHADHMLRRWSGGADLRTLAFLALLAGGVQQLAKGNIAAPAATLFWYAGSLLGLDRPAPPWREDRDA